MMGFIPLIVPPKSLLRESERIPLAPSAPGVPSRMHGFLQERAQRNEIILCHVPALGRLDDFGNVAETRLAHDTRIKRQLNRTSDRPSPKKWD